MGRSNNIWNEEIMAMTAAQYLQYAKDRSYEYTNRGDASGGLARFITDMRQHPELRNHADLQLMAMMMLAGNLKTPTEVRKFIGGFS
jgi:hypothetical protein